jgi:hypothetical protein
MLLRFSYQIETPIVSPSVRSDGPKPSRGVHFADPFAPRDRVPASETVNSTRHKRLAGHEAPPYGSIPLVFGSLLADGPGTVKITRRDSPRRR